METKEIQIPERHIELIRKIGQICRESGIDNCSGSFSPPYGDEWKEAISFSWKQGRHGEDSDKIYLHSTKHVWTRLGPKEK